MSMNFIVAGEPSSWIEPLRARLGPARVFAPRAADVLARATSRAWARGAADRILSLRFLRRRLVGELAARVLPRDATAVYAPCGAADRVFAVARQRGIKTVLVHDLPSLRELHADLDVAAGRFPDCVFLRRFRATRADVVRQETERALADEILVRGEHARALVIERGAEASRVHRMPEKAPPPRARAPVPPTPTLLLAGYAAARSGTNEALALLDELPLATLLVRAGDGTEPARFLRHPRVRVSSAVERRELRGVSAVIAPAWCESYPPEVTLAHALGVPVIGTLRAMGFVPGTVVARGDVRALASAITASGTSRGEARLT